MKRASPTAGMESASITALPAHSPQEGHVAMLLLPLHHFQRFCVGSVSFPRQVPNLYSGRRTGDVATAKPTWRGGE